MLPILEGWPWLNPIDTIRPCSRGSGPGMPFPPSRLTALLLVAGLSVAEVGLLDDSVRSGSRAAVAQGVISLGIRRGDGGL